MTDTLLCENCSMTPGWDDRPVDWQHFGALPRRRLGRPGEPVIQDITLVDPPLTFCSTECAVEYWHGLAQVAIRAAVQAKAVA